MFYFGVASLMGFLAGSLAVFVAVDSIGQSTAFDAGLGRFLGIAFVVAVVGGGVIWMAYRGVTNRR